MSKVGNYIVGASVVAVLGGAAANMDDADKQILEKQIDKVEHFRDDVREDLKEYATIAWNRAVRNVQRLQEKVKELTDVDFLKQELKEDSHFAYQTIEQLGKAPRIKDLQYQNDTLDVEADVDAYYIEKTNTITNNIVKGSDKDYYETLSILAHEAEHMHQRNKVNFKAGMSIEQHYKKHCYKEIGAMIAGLLQYRAMYKEAKTSRERQEIVQKGCKGEYDYYFKAIERGEIDPNSKEKEDFDKEMKFIAQETTSKWMISYANFYDVDHINFVKGDMYMSNLKPNDENYNKAVSVMMTMGGIDFSSYIEDIDVSKINSTVIKADEMVKNGEKPKKVIDMVWYDENANFSNLLSVENGEFDGFSLEQKYNLAVNKYFASFYGYRAAFDESLNFGEWGKKDFTNRLQDVCEKYNIKRETEKLVDRLNDKKSDDKEASNDEYLQKIREIWTFKNLLTGNQFCLLDGLGVKEPDFSSYVANADVLKEKDDSSIGGMLKNAGRNLFEAVDDMVGSVMSISSKEVIKDEPLSEPRYDLLWHEGRSEVYTTNQVIDTRGDYLLREREARGEKQNVAKKEENGLCEKVASKGDSFKKVDGVIVKKMRGGGR